MRYSRVVLAVAVVSSTQVGAQVSCGTGASGAVHGLVAMRDSGEPVERAIVTYVGNGSCGVLTDAEGRFEIMLPAGEQGLEVSSVGICFGGGWIGEVLEGDTVALVIEGIEPSGMSDALLMGVREVGWRPPGEPSFECWARMRKWAGRVGWEPAVPESWNLPTYLQITQMALSHPATAWALPGPDPDRLRSIAVFGGPADGSLNVKDRVYPLVSWYSPDRRDAVSIVILDARLDSLAVQVDGAEAGVRLKFGRQADGTSWAGEVVKRWN